MKSLFISMILIFSLYAENNSTRETNISNEQNSSLETNSSSETNSTKEDKLSKALKEQMEREKKFAKEQTFYQGDDYDLSYAEVNQDSLDSVPLIEPDYDFNMDDVYD
jgi:hypothetical protein